MRHGARWAGAALAAFVGVGCATAPPGAERLAALGSVAVIARVEAPPVSRLHATGAVPEGDDVDRQLERVIAALESVFETEVRLRGELLDAFGAVPPFRVAASHRVDSLCGSLLVREDGPPDYGNLARAGIGGVLELTVTRVELASARESRPAGLRLEARARFVDLAGAGETWSRELTVEPRAGGPLALDPAAGAVDAERFYLPALEAAARELGRATVAAFRGTPAERS